MRLPIFFSKNCQTDVYHIITGCCLAGYAPANRQYIPEAYPGDAEKVSECMKKYNFIQSILMSYETRRDLCRLSVMKDEYD